MVTATCATSPLSQITCKTKQRDSYGDWNRKRLEKTKETLEVLSLHLDCEPFGTEWV